MKRGNVIIIEGLDGSGKSTAALEAALMLSEQYPEASIDVADSSGLHQFREGRQSDSKFEFVGDQKPTKEMNKLRAAAHLIGFLLVRQHMNNVGAHSDVLISVRDPDRIDPALYAGAYLSSMLGKLSLENRLKLFDALAIGPHADAVVLLETDLKDVQAKIISRGEANEPHETPEALAKVALELPQSVGLYSELFDANIYSVRGLRPNSSARVAEAVEPYVHRSVS